MARVEIQIPDQFPFRCEIEVLVGHVNRANHVGNDTIISLCNEARCRYFTWCGYTDESAEEGQMITADLAAIFQGEAHHGERLSIEVGVGDCHKYGADFVFRITELSSGRPIAIIKMAMLLFDYDNKKPRLASAAFHQRIKNGAGSI